jgi:phenylpropionate dioxygenase-like ring-hydroxylating dioxygenase large terminal subunit
MNAELPGAWMDRSPLFSEVDFARYRMKIPTDRYNSADYQEREFEQLWLRTWQIAGRAEELPEPGDWKVHTIYDQSVVLVRGKDGVIRGFVNACRHRGNRLCEGKGHSKLFLCRYHNWSFDLDGKLLAIAHPDFDGTVEDFVGRQEELGLTPVSVECFGGFVFLNPDPEAAPLDEFLGPAKAVLEAYRMEEWVPVGINVRETLECNWKVVMDAFGEGYHVQGVHRELVGLSDLTRERFQTFGQHCASTVPFGPSFGPDEVEKEVQAILGVPTEQFPLYAVVLPRFAALAEAYRGADGKMVFPAGTTPRALFRRLVRETLTARGYDVSGLIDTQMTDYEYWLFFPNVFIQVCAGDATVIVTDPHPDGDRNRSVWHVMFLSWLPPEERAAKATPARVMPEGEHFPYNYVLEQDYVQMAIQQVGLRNRLYREMTLTKGEPRVAHFHATLDGWVR